jgi:hypothetical protein
MRQACANHREREGEPFPMKFDPRKLTHPSLNVLTSRNAPRQYF